MTVLWDIAWRAGLLLLVVPLIGLAGVWIWMGVQDVRAFRQARLPFTLDQRLKREEERDD